MRRTAPEFANVDTAGDDVALIAFTSGTTGEAKGTCTSTATCWRSATPSRARSLEPAPDDVFTGTPPLAFTFGLGGLVPFPMRFGAVRRAARGGAARRAARGDRRSTGARSASPRRPPTGRCSRKAADSDLVQPAQLRLGRRAAAAPTFEALAAPDRHPHHRRHRLDRDAAHLHRRRAARTSGPARPARPSPATRRCVVDEAMRPLAAGEIGRLAVRGPTGCRYLDDPRQTRVRAATAGTSPATPSRSTRTATSGSRRAPTT